MVNTRHIPANEMAGCQYGRHYDITLAAVYYDINTRTMSADTGRIAARRGE